MPIKTGKTYRGRVRLIGYPIKTKDGFKTKNEAKAWELRTAERLKNPPLENQDLSFSQVADFWLLNCKKRYKLKTCEGKAVIINLAMEFWGHDPFIENLSTMMVENFLNSLDSGKTANRYRRELKTFFNYAVSREIPIKNFAKEITKFKETKFKRYVPPPEDIETMKSYATPLECDIITVIYNTAARAGEIRNLKWEDINLEREEITLWTGKRDASDRQDDTLEITKTLLELLTRLSENKTHKEYVFSRNGEKLEDWWVNEIMTKIYKRAVKAGHKLKYFSLHCIRHHVAALLAYRLSLIEISQILRHRNVSTTDTYLRSLVTIKTKGIKVLDDIQSEAGNVISFQEAANKRGN